MFNVSPAARPRSAFQIAAVEGMIEQFRLVEPGCTGRRQTGTPPSVTSGEVVLGGLGDVARTAIVHQIDTVEPVVAPAETPQRCNVMLGIVGFQAEGLHLSAMDDQEVKDVDRAMSGVVVLHLLDRARDGAANRHPLQNLAIGHLVSAHNSDPVRSQPRGVGVAPKDPLCSLLESRVGASGSPVPRPMGLQVNMIEYPPDCPGTDRYYDPISDGLTCQVFTRPVGEVQPLRQGLQASQFDDLSSLEGGKSWRAAPNVLSVRRRVGRRRRWFDTDGRLSKPWLHRTGIDRPRPQSGRPQPVPKLSERVALETTAVPGSERFAGDRIRRRDEYGMRWVFGRAWQDVPR
jgi:hypothetical protein